MVPTEVVRESEQTTSSRELILDLYLSLIRNLAYYAIELDDEITPPYRQFVHAVANELVSPTPARLEESRGRLRGLLRDYRDQSSAYLNRLRGELADTANALQRTLDSLSQTDDDEEAHLRQALGVLHQLASGESKLPLLPTLRQATDTIEESLAQIAQQHKLTVSQFVVEIGLLHKRIDALETAVSVDALTKLFTRAEMEHRIRACESAALIVLLKVEGFQRTANSFSQKVAQQLAAAFIKRLRNSLVPNALIGRWAEEEFLAITSPSEKDFTAGAGWLREHLSGAYACLQGGKTVLPSIQVEIEVLELAPGPNLEEIFRQLNEFFHHE
jgi:GGDEF domain-containing protein